MGDRAGPDCPLCALMDIGKSKGKRESRGETNGGRGFDAAGVCFFREHMFAGCGYRTVREPECLAGIELF